MKDILRIFGKLFQWAPVSTGLTAAYYFLSALVPAAVTSISADMFDSAAQVLAGEPAQGRLILFGILYFVVYLFNDVLSFIQSIALNAGVYEKGTAFFRMDLYEKIAKLPLIALEDPELLNQKERVDKAVNDEALSGICNLSMRTVRSGVTVVSVAAVLSRYSLWLLPLSFLTVLPYLLARVIRGKEFYYVKRVQAKETRFLTYLWNVFTGRQTEKEMRVMGFGGYLTDKWRTIRDKVNNRIWAVEKKDAVSLLWCDGLRIAGYGISVALVLWMAISGQVSVGVFGASISAFLSMQNSMRSFLEQMGQFPEKRSYARDYFQFLDLPEEPDGSESFPGLRESIVLQDVSFRYPNAQREALHKVSLAIRKGEKIAVLGENGSGKTTLSKVLLGLYPHESGQILYDGKPVEVFSKDSLYESVSAIAQDFASYSLTLRENIAMSDLSRLSDDNAIQKGLSDIGMDGMDLDETLGREFGGRDLSGGQWQKLAIARGLFKDSGLILLDEPTSALDPLIETEILTQFIKAAQDRTALIISHRVGLCKLVDRIVVMKDGKIVETGTHQELLAAGGEYARLYTAQEMWYR